TLEDLERALGEEVELSPAILEKLAEGEVARSPGMKYEHYAPRADITILEGTFEQFKAYVEAHAAQDPACLCFAGEGAKLAPFPAWSTAGKGTGTTRPGISSAACAPWTNRGTGWSTPAAPGRTASRWRCTTA